MHRKEENTGESETMICNISYFLDCLNPHRKSYVGAKWELWGYMLHLMNRLLQVNCLEARLDREAKEINALV